MILDFFKTRSEKLDLKLGNAFPDKECKDECGELPGVTCKYEEGKGAQCFCDAEEKKFVSKEKGCSDKECKDKCGELPGVKCKYGEGKGAQCSCVAEEKIFVFKEKGCSEICNYDFQCRNGGTCVKTGSGGYCKCPEGTDGDFCEEVPACKYLQCGEDAKCEFNSRNNTVSCKCKDFKLTFDEKDKTCKDLCANYTCENGGTCSSGFDESWCICPIHFYGVRCQHEKKEPCRNSTLFCENDGTCLFGRVTQVPVCVCPSSFYGERCELGGIDKITLLNSLIWVGCSAIILLVLVSGCLIVARCRKGGAS